jgi:hypothetical protein
MDRAERERQAVWQRNHLSSQALKWCAKRTNFNLSSAEVSNSEASAMQNCLKNYNRAAGIFRGEKNLFLARLDAIKAEGGDIYGHLNN